MSPQNGDAQSPCQDLGIGNIIAFVSHRKTTTKTSKFKHRSLADRPAQSNAVSAPLRTVLDFVLDVRIALADGQERAVRLFFGQDSVERAEAWRGRHGAGTALALPEGVDPEIIPWPAVATVQVVVSPNDMPTRPICEAIVSALRASGVGYATIPHKLDWPNLWLGSPAPEIRT